MGSRHPQGELAQWIEYGASPRGSIALDQCSRALAWLEGRDFVTPDDVQEVAHDVLRHRSFCLSRRRQRGVAAEDAVDALIAQVAVP